MNSEPDEYDPDELLDMVDQWKFKLHDKLATMTREERVAFWKQAHERARAMGLPVVEADGTITQAPKPKHKGRATG